MNWLPARPGSLRPQAVDALIAVAILLELELEARFDTVVPGPQRLRIAITVVLLVAPVVVRRRWPAAALVASAAVAAVLQAPPTGTGVSGMTGPVLPVVLLAFTAGARLDLRRGLASVTIAAVLIAGGTIWSFAGGARGYSVGAEVFAAIALPYVFWGLGWLWQERNRRAMAFRELVSSLERERERHERAAAAQERIRIGRELQDIIAQNVSAIIIQAGGARQLIGIDPDRAAGAILSVEQTGREALADLRRTLGLLRANEDPRELAPQPGLAQLESLLGSARARGIDCSVRTEGEPSELAAGLDLVGYRVIEAALSAADERRRPTAVTISYGPARFGIQIEGRGPATGLDEQLRGISERIALYNGTLTIRPVNAREYAVNVKLPHEASSR